TFDIDANGIVKVSAKDKATSKEQQIRIQASGGLSDADIEQMVKDAESHAAEDKKRRGLVESKNHAESLVHQTERSIAELGDQVPSDEKQNVETALQALKDVLDGEDEDAIKEKTDALMQASMKLGELAYRKAQEDAAATGENPNAESADSETASADDDVIDADFTESDEDKK
ncbi:MAG: Hsp70 family protein, partial [Alphaproteobacteria bacterium]|nr:Hsp70 family protein [Alphaproteobacteria bacterium]